MSDRVLLIRHMPGERDDRAARCLADRGWRLDARWVAEGDRLPDPRDESYTATVVYGGAQMVEQAAELDYLRAELDWMQEWLATGKPLLGICLGGQILAHSLGAPVGPHPEGLSEIGFVPVQPTEQGREIIPDGLMVYHWHRHGFGLCDGMELLARGPVFENQAFRYGERAYGLQFHPEITAEMQLTWMDKAAHMLELPGAQPRERQLSDSARHMTPLGEWMERFLDHWLPERPLP